ncbi:MAG: phosphohydrolase [bacterium]
MVDDRMIIERLSNGEPIEDLLRTLFPKRKDIITLTDIIDHEPVKLLLKRSNEILGYIGFTEHGFRHASVVAYRTWYIMHSLLYDKRVCELGAISGYLHDIGNVINRNFHDAHSALLSDIVLRDIGMPLEERVEIMIAVGNHDEKTGEPTTAMGSALIIADKSDVHRSRVRLPENIDIDIHDRVNFAARSSELIVSDARDNIILKIEIDTKISKVMEYFEIFTERMVACRKAAVRLGIHFSIIINDTEIL